MIAAPMDREADDQRDDLQVRRRAQQLERFGRADALLFFAAERRRRRPHAFAADDASDDEGAAQDQRRRARQQQVRWCRSVGVSDRQTPMPAMPPSGAPPPTKPNSRLACRGS